MKKVIFSAALILSLGLAACGGNEEAKDTTEEKPSVDNEHEQVENTKTEIESAPEVEKEDVKTIDTSVFEYAKSVEVTDARSTNKQITLKIDLADDAEAGMGTLNVLKQLYDFLQQSDLEGADTVTTLIRTNDTVSAQFTTTVADFIPNDSVPMTEIVLKASEVDKMSEEVKTFGQTMELWD